MGQSIPVKYLAADPTRIAAVGTLSLVKILVPALAETLGGLVFLSLSVLGVLDGLGRLEPWAARRRGRSRAR
ncbi:hypothetical protein KDL01_09265 [Actinospica durhamensis]|uniref:Uncharacterized protein n=1 Tax=Actinospica durhamensis TaxID=1508375 RepID=A0A941EM68_9ACTN|nr:hypothetical protein [Actinospica durhamensis]MBR7833453.1 hypothetical protein [Actinospica durhamensis]